MAILGSGIGSSNGSEIWSPLRSGAPAKKPDPSQSKNVHTRAEAQNLPEYEPMRDAAYKESKKKCIHVGDVQGTYFTVGGITFCAKAQKVGKNSYRTYVANEASSK